MNLAQRKAHASRQIKANKAMAHAENHKRAKEKHEASLKAQVKSGTDNGSKK